MTNGPFNLDAYIECTFPGPRVQYITLQVRVSAMQTGGLEDA